MLLADSEFISISRYKTLEGDLWKSVIFEYSLKYEHNKSTKAIHRDRILDCIIRVQGCSTSATYDYY